MARSRKKPMLELTGTGDAGTTGLLGGGRLSKDDARIEAYGTVDEASSALGLAKALSNDARVKEICEELQRGLYALGAELSTSPEASRPFATMSADGTARLEKLVAELEGEVTMPEGFVLPGSTPASGVTLERAGGVPNPEVGRWLNRLSLLLFVLARFEEGRAGRAAKAARH
jgi:cob(I)alamin adenosyltransferase